MIELKRLTKKFGDFPAVDNLNLTVNSGEIFGFIGPNGAGKTTTIKMMGGILAPSAGTVHIAGIVVQGHAQIFGLHIRCLAVPRTGSAAPHALSHAAEVPGGARRRTETH